MTELIVAAAMVAALVLLVTMRGDAARLEALKRRAEELKRQEETDRAGA